MPTCIQKYLDPHIYAQTHMFECKLCSSACFSHSNVVSKHMHTGQHSVCEWNHLIISKLFLKRNSVARIIWKPETNTSLFKQALFC